MKKVLIGIIVLIVIVTVGILAIGRAPEDVERADISDSVMEKDTTEEVESSEFNEDLQQKIVNYDLSKLNFKFTGYGPGKSHEGTFTGISISDIEHNNNTVSKGTITFFTQSVDTGIDQLDGHLCAENFFNCESYPEIIFSLTDVSRKSDTELTATGDLTMKGITKQISFGIMQNSETFSSDFILDVNQFGFTAPNIVDNEVRIQFDTTL